MMPDDTLNPREQEQAKERGRQEALSKIAPFEEKLDRFAKTCHISCHILLQLLSQKAPRLLPADYERREPWEVCEEIFEGQGWQTVKDVALSSDPEKTEGTKSPEMSTVPSTTYRDPRFVQLLADIDQAWENFPSLIASVLGQSNADAYKGTWLWYSLDDPDFEGFAIFPEHDYQGISSPILLVKSLSKLNAMNTIFGGRVQISSDTWFKVHKPCFIEHAIVLLGVLEES